MPMYEFLCGECGCKFEELVRSSSVKDEEVRCPSCGATGADRLMSAVSLGGSSRPLGSVCSPSGGSGFT